jgi:hypothetical protein
MYSDLTLGDLPLFRSKTTAPPKRDAEAPPFQHENDLSRRAAQSIIPVAGTLRARVLAAIEAGPCTDEEGTDRTGMNPSTWRPRRVELEAAGLIRKVAERPGRSGRMMAVWAAAGVGNVAGT